MTFQRIRLGLSSSALLILAACLGPVSLKAQTSTQGGVTGTVTDPSGAVVPGAAITIQNKATNAIAQAKTDGSGFFNVPLLDPGDYRVQSRRLVSPVTLPITSSSWWVRSQVCGRTLRSLPRPSKL